jgi:hypothetical protein
MNGFWEYESPLVRWLQGQANGAVSHLVTHVKDQPSALVGLLRALLLGERTPPPVSVCRLVFQKFGAASCLAQNGSCREEERQCWIYGGEWQVPGSAATKLTRLPWSSVPDSSVLSFCNPAVAHYMV